MRRFSCAMKCNVKPLDLCYPKNLIFVTPKNLHCLYREAFKTGIWPWFQPPKCLGEFSSHSILPDMKNIPFGCWSALERWQSHGSGTCVAQCWGHKELWSVCDLLLWGGWDEAGCCCIPTKGSAAGQALSQPTQTCCTWLITFIMVIFSPSQEQGTVQNQPPFVSPGTANLFPQATPPF